VTLIPVWPSASDNGVGTPDGLISQLDGWPACAPVNVTVHGRRPLVPCANCDLIRIDTKNKDQYTPGRIRSRLIAWHLATQNSSSPRWRSSPCWRSREEPRHADL